LITSVSYLTLLLEQHPAPNKRSNYVWVKRHADEHISYGFVQRMLKAAAKQAKISKTVSPHQFRHARATHLASKLTDSQLKIMFGWEPTSKMVGTYVHLSGKNVDDALLRLHGIKKKEATEDVKVCPRCTEHNPEVLRFCGKCGMPLSLKAAAEVEEKRAKLDNKMEGIMKLLEDKEVQELLARKIATLP